jgi:uncharacterized protein YabN with tetrapyrrole methylase and pyrophosphatase domain
LSEDDGPGAGPPNARTGAEAPAASGSDLGAVAALDAVAHRLRRECPWDREQDERSIVPHTVEEAYELADAAYAGDDGKLLDELGDVLFQVVFLALLLEERGAGDLDAVAESCRQKLIRRHPHVFGNIAADTAADVRANWDEIKRVTEGRGRGGIFSDVPETLPGPLYARKVLRRAASAGRLERHPGHTIGALSRGAEALRDAGARSGAGAEGASGTAPGAEDRFVAAGDLLFAAVAAAWAHEVDPELALRAAADRFRSDVEEDDGRG